MTASTRGDSLLAQTSARAVEACTVWADINQRILRELVDLAATTSKEGVRLFAEMQSAAVEAMREGQSLVLERQASLDDTPRDPISLYHQGILGSLESTQRALRVLEGSAQAMTRSAERLQATAEQTGKGLHASFVELDERLKHLYAPLT